MAAFEAVADATLSADGLTLTLKDASDYTNNTEGYTTANFTRQVVLSDAYSNILATIPFTGSALTVPHALAADRWIIIDLQLVGVAAEGDYSDTRAIGCDRITKTLFKKILKQMRYAGNLFDKRLDFADGYLTGAAIEQLAGNGPGFNVDISSAYKYLTSPKW